MIPCFPPYARLLFGHRQLFQLRHLIGPLNPLCPANQQQRGKPSSLPSCAKIGKPHKTNQPLQTQSLSERGHANQIKSKSLN